MNPRHFRSLLHAGGLDACLRELNRNSPYRYTAVFAFHGEVLRNLSFVDKLDATAARCPDQSVADSYCVYVRRDLCKVGIEDAASDARTTDHPKRATLLSYFGVPLVADTGQVLGTV